MAKAIKNYTSSVSPFVSIGEIQAALASHGATKVMVDYDGGNPVAVTFALPASTERYAYSSRKV